MIRVFLWLVLGAGGASGAEAIGSYGNGCLLGGVTLGEEGPGFETIRRTRRRYYAHPATRDFLHAYGRALDTVGLGRVLVGDAAQAGGGRMPSGHRSHQTGLDVDFWFTRPGKRDRDDRFGRLVDTRAETIDPRVWVAGHATMLRLAAERPEVARVFVHWVIKQKLCTLVGPEKPAWLGKIRPWWGHDRHFHVRLRCPEGSADCVNQAEPTGHACGEERWFSKSAVAKRKARGKPPTRRRARPLHPRCRKPAKRARKKRR